MTHLRSHPGRAASHLEKLVEMAADPKATRERLAAIQSATRERNEAEARARQALADLQAEREELEQRRASLIAEERVEFEAEIAAWRARVRAAIEEEDEND